MVETSGGIPLTSKGARPLPFARTTMEKEQDESSEEDVTTAAADNVDGVLGCSPKSSMLVIGDHHHIGEISVGLQEYQLNNNMKQSKNAVSRRLSMSEFLQAVPEHVQQRKQLDIVAGSSQDPIMKLFDRLDLNESSVDEWRKYALFDTNKCYTRNLVATDHMTYTVMLLCWNCGQYSPIHDHPCDGCWMRVLQGKVHECRYQQLEQHQQVIQDENNDDHDYHHLTTNSNNRHLVCTQDTQVSANDGTVFIQDSLGYHKVGNPSSTKPAITLHLYSPPFQKCHIWLNGSDQPATTTCVCYHSEYGTKV